MPLPLLLSSVPLPPIISVLLILPLFGLGTQAVLFLPTVETGSVSAHLLASSASYCLLLELEKLAGEVGMKDIVVKFQIVRLQKDSF